MDNEKYLSFKLAGEWFAIPVSQVREILELGPLTSVPGAPVYVRGVVNVRVKAVPVVELRVKLGLPPGAETVQARIVTRISCWTDSPRIWAAWPTAFTK